MQTHKENKLVHNPTTHPDDELIKLYGLINFVLLSVEDGKPLIDSYEAAPDPIVTKITDRTAANIDLARTLYRPAIFSLTFLPIDNPDRVKMRPERCVRDALEGNPYVIMK